MHGRPLFRRRIAENYQRFEESLGKLDMEGVELIPQTMAPFPGTSKVNATKTISCYLMKSSSIVKS